MCNMFFLTGVLGCGGLHFVTVATRKLAAAVDEGGGRRLESSTFLCRNITPLRWVITTVVHSTD